jgi:hypothetical protein
MNTPKFTGADVINAVGVTLDLMYKASGIKFDNLDEAMIDKLPRSSFTEYISGGTLVADSFGVERS